MPQYLVAGYMPDDFDPSSVTEAMGGYEVAASAARWQGARHRRAVPGNQGTHRRSLYFGMR
jgi:hypothetical protein